MGWMAFASMSAIDSSPTLGVDAWLNELWWLPKAGPDLEWKPFLLELGPPNLGPKLLLPPRDPKPPLELGPKPPLELGPKRGAPPKRGPRLPKPDGP